MFTHYKCIFLSIIILLHVINVNCSNTSTATNEKTKVNLEEKLTITFSLNGDISPNGAVAIGQGTQAIACVAAAYTGAYSFENVLVYNSDASYAAYTMHYFIDKNNNKTIDSNEEWSVVDLGAINMQDIVNNAEPLSYDLVYYRGTVKFHSAMSKGTFLTKHAYLYSKYSTVSARTIPVEADGAFEFIEKRQGSADPDEAIHYELYAFYDDLDGDGLGDGVMSEFNDAVAFVQTLNTYYSSFVYSELLQVSGKVSFTPLAQTAGIYPFTSTVNPPVIKIEDQCYWRSVLQQFSNAQNSAGAYTADFAVFAPVGRLIDIRMYHVQSNVGDYVANAKKKIIMPVQLTGAYAYTADTIIHGIGSVTNPMKIHTISATLRRNAECVIHGNVIAVIGSFPITYNLYAFSNNTIQDTTFLTTNDISTSEDMTFYVFFRDYDRTTDTEGAQNDAALDMIITGYVPFFNVKFAIDTNFDVKYVAGEPVSGTYYYGDSAVVGYDNGLPDWAPSGNGDYNDLYYPSYIDENKTIATGFEIK